LELVASKIPVVMQQSGSANPVVFIKLGIPNTEASSLQTLQTEWIWQLTRQLGGSCQAVATHSSW